MLAPESGLSHNYPQHRGVASSKPVLRSLGIHSISTLSVPFEWTVTVILSDRLLIVTSKAPWIWNVSAGTPTFSRGDRHGSLDRACIQSLLPVPVDARRM